VQAVDEISGCRQINATNRPSDGVVNLTADITDSDAGSCIEIATNDIVFDGQGHTVDGDGTGSDDLGINVTGSATLSGVTVRNVTVSNWDDGVKYDDVNGGLLNDVTTTDNGGDGIELLGTTDVDITASNASANSRGVGFFSGSSDGTVTDTVAVNNDGSGFHLPASYTFKNSTARGNGGGFQLFGDNRLVNSTAIDNTASNDWDVKFTGDANNTAENLDLGASTAPNTTVDFNGTDARLRGVTSPPSDPGGERNVSRFVETDAGPGSSFLNITFQYDDGDVSGINESTLTVWNHDGSWTELGVDAHDTNANEIRYNATNEDSFLTPLGTPTAPTIDGCREINAGNVPEDGVVKLTSDITDSGASSCIEIRTDDVVFDGQGYTIDGDGSGDGINVTAGSSLSNVTIRDVTVTDWSNGVKYDGVSNGLVKGVTATSNSLGIQLLSATGVDVESTNASGNSLSGVKMFGASGGTIRDTLANDNGDDGFDGGISMTFRNVTANNNANSGFDGSSQSTFVDSTANNNDGNGFSVGFDSVLQNVTAIDNAGWDFSGGSNSTVAEFDVGPSTAANTLVNFTSRDVRLAGVSSPPADPSGERNISRFVEAESTAQDAFLDITFQYENGDVAGVDESNLSVWKHDRSWTELGIDAHDTGANTIRYNVTNVGSTFAPLANTSTGGGGGVVGEVSSCHEINASNRPSDGVVKLTADITDSTASSCIDIKTDDVVFDGQGYTVDGDGAGGTNGIMVTGTGTLSNVTVRNVTLSDWGEDGIRYSDVSDGLITNVTSTNNGVGSGQDGIEIQSSTVDVVASNVSGNAFGIYLSGSSSDGTVTDTVVSNNDDDGILSGSSYTYRNVTANENGNDGINTNHDNVFINSTAIDNANWDFRGKTNNTATNFDVGASTAANTTIDFTARDVELKGVSSPPADPGGEQNISRFVEVENTTQDAYLDVTFQYENGDVSGVDESRLDVWKHNGSWTELGIDAHDTGANEIRYNVTNVGSTFAPLANTNTGGGVVDEISSCRQINASNRPAGGLVKLTADITDSGASSCIEITTSDVTFDGQGYSVDGTGSGIGINVTGSGTLSNVTVRDVTVTDWDDGVRYSDVNGGLVSGVTVTDSGSDGMEISGSTGVDIAASNASGNRYGIFLPTSTDGTVTDTLANDNDVSGFLRGSSYTFRNVTAIGNGGEGFNLAENNVLINSTAFGNANWDFISEANNTAENFDVGMSTAANTTVDFTARNVELSGVSSPPADPSGERNISRFVEATNRSQDAYLDLTFQYEDSDVTGMNESTLSVDRYNAASGQWETVPGSTVDTNAQTVSANITAFSTFGVIGEPNVCLSYIQSIAGQNGKVETTELFDAIDDWRDDNIDTACLLDVIDYWRSDKKV